jgi:hypothetical protein
LDNGAATYREHSKAVRKGEYPFPSGMAALRLSGRRYAASVFPSMKTRFYPGDVLLAGGALWLLLDWLGRRKDRQSRNRAA